MTATTLPSVSADGGLSRYFREIWAFPMLSREDEQLLALRWREQEDVDAAHRLVTSHLRLVAKIAMSYRGYGLPMADLISEGNIGLMKAVKKFDPDMGNRLSTYAMWWVRAAITEYILKSWSLVKLGTVASQKKLFFSLRGIKRKLKIADNGELDSDQVQLLSDAVGLSESEVVNMNRRLAARDMSLNAQVGREDEDSLEYIDTLTDDGPSPEAALAASQEHDARRSLLQRAIATLPERERVIFSARRLQDEPRTLADLGDELGLSRERIRQLEVRAFEAVERAVKSMSAEMPA